MLQSGTKTTFITLSFWSAASSSHSPLLFLSFPTWQNALEAHGRSSFTVQVEKSRKREKLSYQNPLFEWMTTAFFGGNISDNLVDLTSAMKKKKAKGSMNFFQNLENEDKIASFV